MGRLPRYHPPDAAFEVTHRTIDGQLMLRPSPELNERIEAVIARAQKLYGIEIFFCVFLANHYHLLGRARDLATRSAFLRHIHRNIAIAAREINGGSGPLWAGRPKIQIVRGNGALLRRLRYLASNGVKEGLVATPVKWPGASAARALVAQRDIVTVWRTKAQRLAHARGRKSEGEVNVLRLSPLPAHSALRPSRRKRIYRQLFAEIAAEARERRNGRPPLGAAAILRQDPTTRVPLERRGAPLAFTNDASQLRAFEEEYGAYVGWFRKASAQHLAGEIGVKFPPGACPPAGPYVPHTAPEAQPAVWSPAATPLIVVNTVRVS